MFVDFFSCQDSSCIEALVKCLREEQFGGQVAEPPDRDPARRASQLHRRLQSTTNFAPTGLDNSGRARPHLVQKLLLWEISKGEIQDLDSVGALQSMQLPDAHNNLGTIPSQLQGPDLQTRFCCPLLLLSCYASLARPALQQHPQALEVTRAAPTRVRAALTAYRDTEGKAPSLEQLYAAVFAAPGPCATRSPNL